MSPSDLTDDSFDVPRLVPRIGEAAPGAAVPSPPPVEVVRSSRRVKTVSARMVDGVIRIRIPAHLSAEEERRFVEKMVDRLGRQRQAAHIDLTARARTLARRHHLPVPDEIRWVSNQQHRWGSCSPATGVIRISDRLAAWPGWVLDFVVVHELAHLVERHHNPAFHDLVARYPLTERAIGFLIAKGMVEGDGPDGPDR